MSRQYGQHCPIARTLDLIGDRWTMLILRDLFLGNTKFTELRERSPGMPTKMLADRLKSLEQHRIVQRRVYSEHPLRAEYRLTSVGRSLEPVITAIYDWGMKHTIAPAERARIRRRIAAARRPLALRATASPSRRSP